MQPLTEGKCQSATGAQTFAEVGKIMWQCKLVIEHLGGSIDEEDIETSSTVAWSFKHNVVEVRQCIAAGPLDCILQLQEPLHPAKLRQLE